MSAFTNYTDILSCRRSSSDFTWVSRDFSPSHSNVTAPNKTDHNRIHQDVLRSPRIQKIIQEIKLEMKNNPVIFLPSHRSYADFILMAYVAFHYEIELPCVAAGMDFQSMWLMGQLLRDTHAFFMRRSFGDDKLYKAVFDEYVQTLVISGDLPIEFFIEGTRSRSAKSLLPKFGMLSMSLAPLLEEHVSDITIVPVNLSYDRTLEESLFSFELLGVPKPKETTSGLLKALHMLDEKYGNVYINFCKPFSAKVYLKNIPSQLSPITDLAFTVVDRQQRSCVVSCFNLISMVLTNHLLVNDEPLYLKQLVSDVSWLRSVMQELSVSTVFAIANILNAIEEAIHLHKSLVKLSNESALQLVPVDLALSCINKSRLKGHELTDETMLISLPVFTLQHYVNPCLYFLVNMALITTVLQSNRDTSYFTWDFVFQKFQFLRRILAFEFIFYKKKEEEDFLEALKKLELLNMIEEQEDGRLCPGNHFKLQALLCNLFYPFLSSYLCTMKCLPNVCSDWQSQGTIVKKAQAEIEAELVRGNLLHPYSLSIELIQSCLKSLQNMGLLLMSKMNGFVRYKVARTTLLNIISQLEGLIIRPVEKCNDARANVKRLMTFTGKQAKL
nr:PREDICTED: dihydroxyacetone phosphate acyltransferase isoform X2 [Bemisia tabaci]